MENYRISRLFSYYSSCTQGSKIALVDIQGRGKLLPCNRLRINSDETESKTNMSNGETKTAAVATAENKLTSTEKGELARHEKTIAEGLRTFKAVGLALVAIRDGRLYRDTHSTFEAYLASRWGISRGRAYQLVDAAKIASEFDPNLNEYAAAKLNAVDPNKRKVVYAKAKAAAAKEGRTTPSAADIMAASNGKGKRNAKPEGNKTATPVTTLAEFEKNLWTLVQEASKKLGWAVIVSSLDSAATKARLEKASAKKAA